jgi:hypothetical protein
MPASCDNVPDLGPLGELFAQNMPEPKLGEVLSLFEQMASFHPHEPHWYILLIGIDPLFQGRDMDPNRYSMGWLPVIANDNPLTSKQPAPPTEFSMSARAFAC